MRLRMLLGRWRRAAGPAPSAPRPQQAKQLSIATGGTGGIYYPLAGGFGSIIAKEIPGITRQPPEVTGGLRSTT